MARCIVRKRPHLRSRHQQKLVALALPDHEFDLGDQKVARFVVVVDFAGALEIVQRNLDRVLYQ